MNRECEITKPNKTLVNKQNFRNIYLFLLLSKERV
jgi:hypothetical protein